MKDFSPFLGDLTVYHNRDTLYKAAFLVIRQLKVPLKRSDLSAKAYGRPATSCESVPKLSIKRLHDESCELRPFGFLWFTRASGALVQRFE